MNRDIAALTLSLAEMNRPASSAADTVPGGVPGPMSPIGSPSPSPSPVAAGTSASPTMLSFSGSPRPKSMTLDAAAPGGSGSGGGGEDGGGIGVDQLKVLKPEFDKVRAAV